jgi:hypothetical protein
VYVVDRGEVQEHFGRKGGETESPV